MKKAVVGIVSVLGLAGALAMACSSGEVGAGCDPATDPTCAPGGDTGGTNGDGTTGGDTGGTNEDGGFSVDSSIGEGGADGGADGGAVDKDTGLVVLPDGSVILPDGAIVLPDGAILTDAGPLPPCVPGGSQCTNCIDDDGDGLVDWLDPECTGPLDNDENSFSTGIPGDNIDACKQDCWFDGNSGAGDDKCDMDARCLVGSTDPKCPYSAAAAADPKICPPLSDACVKFCKPLTPKGCDCLGCCDVYKDGKLYTVKLTAKCTYEKLGTADCPTCGKVESCSNPCGKCDWCLGKTELPPECYPPPPPPPDAGAPDGSTTPDAGTDAPAPSPCPVGTGPVCSPTAPCPTGFYCLTGCCIKAPS